MEFAIRCNEKMAKRKAACVALGIPFDADDYHPDGRPKRGVQPQTADHRHDFEDSMNGQSPDSARRGPTGGAFKNSAGETVRAYAAGDRMTDPEPGRIGAALQDVLRGPRRAERGRDALRHRRRVRRQRAGQRAAAGPGAGRQRGDPGRGADAADERRRDDVRHHRERPGRAVAAGRRRGEGVGHHVRPDRPAPEDPRRHRAGDDRVGGRRHERGGVDRVRPVSRPSPPNWTGRCCWATGPTRSRWGC